jgi:hypothetical protein
MAPVLFLEESAKCFFFGFGVLLGKEWLPNTFEIKQNQWNDPLRLLYFFLSEPLTLLKGYKNRM